MEIGSHLGQASQIRQAKVVVSKSCSREIRATLRHNPNVEREGQSEHDVREKDVPTVDRRDTRKTVTRIPANTISSTKIPADQDFLLSG